MRSYLYDTGRGWQLACNPVPDCGDILSALNIKGTCVDAEAQALFGIVKGSFRCRGYSGRHLICRHGRYLQTDVLHHQHARKPLRLRCCLQGRSLAVQLPLASLKDSHSSAIGVPHSVSWQLCS